VADASIVKVHSSAMLALITGSTALGIDTVPETLLMDIRRLSAFRNEFNRIVDGCTVIVTMSQARPSASSFMEFSKLVVDMQEVSASSCIAALGTTGLVGDNTTLSDCLDKANPVRTLVSSRIHTLFEDKLERLESKAGSFLNTARAFIPAIEAQIVKLVTFSNFNCAIYLPVYQRLLGVGSA